MKYSIFLIVASCFARGSLVSASPVSTSESSTTAPEASSPSSTASVGVLGAPSQGLGNLPVFRYQASPPPPSMDEDGWMRWQVKHMSWEKLVDFLDMRNEEWQRLNKQWEDMRKEMEEVRKEGREKAVLDIGNKMKYSEHEIMELHESRTNAWLEELGVWEMEKMVQDTRIRMERMYKRLRRMEQWRVGAYENDRTELRRIGVQIFEMWDEIKRIRTGKEKKARVTGVEELQKKSKKGRILRYKVAADHENLPIRLYKITVPPDLPVPVMTETEKGLWRVGDDPEPMYEDEAWNIVQKVKEQNKRSRQRIEEERIKHRIMGGRG